MVEMACDTKDEKKNVKETLISERKPRIYVNISLCTTVNIKEKNLRMFRINTKCPLHCVAWIS
jgi:hypothetical protein